MNIVSALVQYYNEFVVLYVNWIKSCWLLTLLFRWCSPGEWTAWSESYISKRRQEISDISRNMFVFTASQEQCRATRLGIKKITKSFFFLAERLNLETLSESWKCQIVKRLKFLVGDGETEHDCSRDNGVVTHLKKFTCRK